MEQPEPGLSPIVRTTTYGEHAEAAATALNQLLVEDHIPAEPAAVDQMLHCREAVIDALRQRMYAFGLGARHLASRPPPPSTLRLNRIDQRLATLLDRTAFEVPSLPLDERKAPTDVLGAASTDPTVEWWRHAAIELLAGSHALDTAQDRPWLTHFGAGWYLMRDVAVAMEAFLVLDERLVEVGLLSQHHHPQASLGLGERRLVASQCARVATWFATSDAPDRATPRTSAQEHVVIGPVHLVSTTDDLAGAQWRLATFLRPVHANDTSYTGEPEISADTARHIVASQLFLTQFFATLTHHTPGTETLRGEFIARQRLLHDIQPQLRYLVDVEPHDLNRHRTWQQGEITTALRRMQRDQAHLAMQPAQLLELANATHEVTHNLARSLRRELLRTNSNLRTADPTNQIGATHVVRGSGLETSLTDLINQPPPTAPVARFTSPLQRAALRRTLDETPTHQDTPSPYPRARNIDTSDAPAF